MQSFPTDVNAQDTNQSNTTIYSEHYKKNKIKILVIGTRVGVERGGEGKEGGRWWDWEK